MSQSCFCLCLCSHVFGKGKSIFGNFYKNLNEKLSPLCHGHLFTLCHDADELEKHVKCDLETYLPDKCDHFTGPVHYKVGELKKNAAHFIKIYDIKGLKTFLLCRIRLLKEYLIKHLVYLKALTAYQLRVLKVKLMITLEKFKAKLRCLTDKIDVDVEHKIHELHDLGYCKHDSHEHKCCSEESYEHKCCSKESCEHKCCSEESCEHKGHVPFCPFKIKRVYKVRKYCKK